MQKEAFEATGLIPRSIIRTFERFLQQLLPGSETIAIREYRLSRYQIRVSLKSLFQLICIPLLVNYTVKPFLIKPVVQYVWDSRQQQLFLNHDQQKQAFRELHNFSETLFFDALLLPVGEDEDSLLSLSVLQTPPSGVWDTPSGIPKVSQKLTAEQKISSGYPLRGSEKSSLHFTSITSTKNKFGEGLDSATKASLLDGKSIECTNLTNQADILSVGNMISFPFASLDIPAKSFLNSQALPPSEVSKFCDAKPASYPDKVEVQIGAPHSLLISSGSNLLTESQTENLFSPETIEAKKAYQLKSLEIAQRYNTQSILAITNVFGDLLIFVTVSLLFVLMRAQIIILQSFVTEFIYSLSDTSKSFLLILGMDLLVGFHSPRAWELALQALLAHVGLPENENFILLFVALFPVFLDTVFKYWIFRYLNKISPSTVVTYHSMLE